MNTEPTHGKHLEGPYLAHGENHRCFGTLVTPVGGEAPNRCPGGGRQEAGWGWLRQSRAKPGREAVPNSNHHIRDITAIEVHRGPGPSDGPTKTGLGGGGGNKPQLPTSRPLKETLCLGASEAGSGPTRA